MNMFELAQHAQERLNQKKKHIGKILCRASDGGVNALELMDVARKAGYEYDSATGKWYMVVPPLKSSDDYVHVHVQKKMTGDPDGEGKQVAADDHFLNRSSDYARDDSGFVTWYGVTIERDDQEFLLEAEHAETIRRNVFRILTRFLPMFARREKSRLDQNFAEEEEQGHDFK
ncbi:unnamed protein product [Arabis nemorensis]|uniref:Uncharacterized protein n=1 Tax=Arabis nemorensis TaxID=586526 RepID=A0A565BS12_9BRAS|nr:unnamed protein product [Arabis nemorensis]